MKSTTKSIPIAALVAHLEKVSHNCEFYALNYLSKASNTRLTLELRSINATEATAQLHVARACRQLIADIKMGDIDVVPPKKPKRKAKARVPR